MAELTIYANVRAPFSVCGKPSHTLAARLALLLRSPVLHVLPLRREPKVGPAVVHPVHVCMVNERVRPLAGHVEPCETVQAIGPSVKSDGQVITFTTRGRKAGSGYNSRRNALSSTVNNPPGKHSGIGVVPKKRSQPIGDYLLFGHSMAPVQVDTARL